MAMKLKIIYSKINKRAGTSPSIRAGRSNASDTSKK